MANKKKIRFNIFIEIPFTTDNWKASFGFEKSYRKHLVFICFVCLARWYHQAFLHCCTIINHTSLDGNYHTISYKSLNLFMSFFLLLFLLQFKKTIKPSTVILQSTVSLQTDFANYACVEKHTECTHRHTGTNTSDQHRRDLCTGVLEP